MKNLLRYVLGTVLAWCLRFRSRPYAFPPGLALVLAPHADDETLGCGGLLALKNERGDPVEVVFISDSAGASEEPTTAGLAGRRHRESLAALAALGIGAEHVHFLAAPDGHLNRLAPGESARVQSVLVDLVKRLEPAEVFVPYLGGGSTEHDATVQLARNALSAIGAGTQVWEYPVWAWWDPRRLVGQLWRPEQNFHLSLGMARARKHAALACHASQLEALPGTRQPALPPVLAALCTGPTEFFFHRQP